MTAMRIALLLGGVIGCYVFDRPIIGWPMGLVVLIIVLSLLADRSLRRQCQPKPTVPPAS